MKRAILQVQIKPEEGQQVLTRTFKYISNLYDLSAKQARKYAAKCDADYIQITDCSFLPDKHPAFQRLKFFDLDQYDQILYLDSDAVVLDDIPNIFELYKDHEFCATMDRNWTTGSDYALKEKDKVCKRLKASSDYIPFCSGVMLMNKTWLTKAKEVYKKYLYEFDKHGYYDQGIMNSCVIDLGEKYTILDKDWGAWYTTGKYIVHLASTKKLNFDIDKFTKKYNIKS